MCCFAGRIGCETEIHVLLGCRVSGWALVVETVPGRVVGFTWCPMGLRAFGEEGPGVIIFRFGSCGCQTWLMSGDDGRTFSWRCSVEWTVFGCLWVVWCVIGCIVVAPRRWGSGHNDILVVIVVRPGWAHGVRSALSPPVLGWVGGSMVVLDLLERCWTRWGPAKAAGIQVTRMDIE